MTRAIVLTLFGLTLWVVAFSAIYALHGMGCALGWPARALGPISLHRAAMLAVWLGALAIHLWTLRAPAFATGPLGRLPRLGAWAGAVATLFTLFPLAVLGEC